VVDAAWEAGRRAETGWEANAPASATATKGEAGRGERGRQLGAWRICVGGMKKAGRSVVSLRDVYVPQM